MKMFCKRLQLPHDVASAGISSRLNPWLYDVLPVPVSVSQQDVIKMEKMAADFKTSCYRIQIAP
jgi:hypothetical protein